MRVVTVSTRTPPKPTPLIYLVSHMKNEAVLLPQWIRHHAHMFDGAIIIDYHSQDDSGNLPVRHTPLHSISACLPMCTLVLLDYVLLLRWSV